MNGQNQTLRSQSLRKRGFVAGLALGVASFFAAGNVIETANAKPVQSVTPLVEIDRPVVLSGQTEPIFVLVRFEAMEVLHRYPERRPPLNLSLVLDRSGSMEDTGKIEYLKKAAKMAVDRLSGKDYLSIVEYDDQITVMWPSARVESTYPIKRLIDALEPRGSTNLVGGMMRGVDEVQDRLDDIESDKTISRVLLLSDGLANQGVTDPREIRRLVRAAKKDGVRISTMGLGRDYDEDLMQAIAEYAGGTYYYIEHPNQMARIFEQELRTLFTTVAKDVRFEFSAAQGIKDVQVVSFGSAEEPGSSDFDMEDFYAGEKRSLLLRIEPEEGLFEDHSGNVGIGEISFTYKEAETGLVEEFISRVTVELTDDKNRAAAATNNEVLVEARLFEAERLHTAAISQYEAGNFEVADEMMASLAEDVEADNSVLNDQRLDNKIEALRVERDQMSVASAAPEQRSSYLKSTKQRLYNAQKGKRGLYLLQNGDKGFEVERLQEALKEAGAYDGPIDGVYSSDVEDAVEAVQSEENLEVDGIAGPSTMQTLGLY